MESLVQQAREAHRLSHDHSRLSAHHRERRDTLIRRAYGSGSYSYGTLARQVGCSPELVAKIIKGRPERGRPLCEHCGEPLGSKCPNCGRRRHEHTRQKCYLC